MVYGLWSMNNSKFFIFALLCAGNVAISFNTGAVSAAIPIIGQSLGQPDFLVAKLVPYYMIPYGLGALLYAPLVRALNYRLVLMAAMAVFSLMSLVSGLSHAFGTILWAQIGAGMAAASSTPLSLMVIGDFFERDIRGRLVGIYFGCSFFTSVVGLVFMGVVDWRWLFLVPSILGASVAIILFFLKNSILNKRHDEYVNYFHAFLKPEIRKVFILIFLMSFFYHAVQKWYGVYLFQEYGLDKKAISWILILGAVSGLLGQQIGGYLSDKRGRAATCRIGIGLWGTAVCFLVGHYPVFLLPIIIGIVTIGWTMSHNSISTILTDFPDEDRPVMASLNSSVRFVSGGVGFSLSAFFVAQNFQLTFLGIGCLILLLIYILKYILTNE